VTSENATEKESQNSSEGLEFSKQDAKKIKEKLRINYGNIPHRSSKQASHITIISLKGMSISFARQVKGAAR
jgi:hypothetical protein